jgi:hypothetical protein
VKEEASNWVVVGKKPIPHMNLPRRRSGLTATALIELNKRDGFCRGETVLKRSGRQAIRGRQHGRILEFRARAITNVKVH